MSTSLSVLSLVCFSHPHSPPQSSTLGNKNFPETAGLAVGCRYGSLNIARIFRIGALSIVSLTFLACLSDPQEGHKANPSRPRGVPLPVNKIGGANFRKAKYAGRCRVSPPHGSYEAGSSHSRRESLSSARPPTQDCRKLDGTASHAQSYISVRP